MQAKDPSARLMSTQDDNFPAPPPGEPDDEPGESAPPSATSAGGLLAPPPEALPSAVLPSRDASLPEDLRTPWSWAYLIVFVLFAFASLVFLDMTFAILAMIRYHLNLTQLQKLAMTSASWVTARQAVWFGLLMLYLFLMIRVRQGLPFWRTIGWRKLHPRSLAPGAAAIVYLAGGSALAIAISLASRLVRPNTKLPIEQLFQSRRGALLIMTLAVLGAPLVEETVFRGYIYPVLARSFGVPLGVLGTGVLFGLVHAPQLGGAWGVVALLVTVGVVLTYVRARSGTVLASFLLHLGYNSMLFLAAAVSTGGFRHLPGGS